MNGAWFLELYRKFPRPEGTSARWLVWETMKRDACVHGRDTRGWHATNIALHTICTALVYVILSGFWPAGAFLGALIFAFHPAATASVASISGRFGLMCAAFYFAALLAAIIGGRAWLAVPPLAYGAWSSKEESVMLPFAIIATLIVMRFV